jgi:WD40 repeat protein
VRALTFSPNGKYLATCSGGKDLSNRKGTGEGRIWDVANQKLVLSVFTLNESPMAAAFSPDGKRLVVGGDLGSLSFWNVGEDLP